jgi:hypothetical protein
MLLATTTLDEAIAVGRVPFWRHCLTVAAMRNPYRLYEERGNA